jgi:hypothetical protein
MKLSRVQRLRDAGFDQSYPIPFEHSWKVRCSQCEALVINGIACHETGCPHIPRDTEEED